MDGIALCERIAPTREPPAPRHSRHFARRAGAAERGLEAWADAYITKSSFDQDTLARHGAHAHWPSRWNGLTTVEVRAQDPVDAPGRLASVAEARSRLRYGDVDPIFPNFQAQPDDNFM